ncbi:MAG TPA: HAD family phosphatase [Bryobacteraceae bacterium]|nr:HAD family phosphatase [Bryobacteraceae bacterium]
MPVQALIRPKAVVFDYGNVLCVSQDRADVEAMAAVFDVPTAQFESVYWRDRLSFDAAEITPEAHWATTAAGLSRTLSDAQRERLIELDNLSWVHPNPIMIQWAGDLRKAGMRTAVLSNMPITLRSYLRTCTWLPEFDHSCYSCDVHCAKPGAEIYRLCLEGLRVKPEDALFLDDREENIEAARKLGIHTIHFRSPEEAQCQIDQHYCLPLPIPLAAGGEKLASRSQSSS